MFGSSRVQVPEEVEAQPWWRVPVVLADRLGVRPGSVLVGLAMIIAAAIAVWFAVRPPPVLTEQLLPTVTETPLVIPSTAPVEADILVVHVDGAVRRPGVHEVRAGARVIDAIDAAGGLRADADRHRVNLALVLADAQRIWVPIVGEEEPAVLALEGGDSANDEKVAPLVNLNTADANRLETLPGIGPSLAAAIIDHREREGAFGKVGELLGVTGIGPAKLDQIRSLVSV